MLFKSFKKKLRKENLTMKKVMILVVLASVSFFMLSSMAFAGGILVKNSLPVDGEHSKDVNISVDVPIWFDPDADLSPGQSETLHFGCNDGQDYVVKCKVIKKMGHDVHIQMDGVQCGERVRVIYDNAYKLEKFFD